MQVIFYISLKRLRTGILYYIIRMKRIILIILAIVAFGIDINATNTTITNVDVETPSGNMNSNIKIFAIFV